MKEIPDISILIRGEPEITARETLIALYDDRDLSNILGISYRVAKNGIKHNPERPFIEDLDRLPIPAYELMPMERYVSPYRNTMAKSAAIVTSRGCPNGCYFCCTYMMGGKKVRVKSIPRVMEEIAILTEDHGVQFIHFIDDTLNLDYERLRALCEELIKREFGLAWNAQMVLPRNDDQERMFLELIPLMKKQGAVACPLGWKLFLQQQEGTFPKRPRAIYSHIRGRKGRGFSRLS